MSKRKETLSYTQAFMFISTSMIGGATLIIPRSMTSMGNASGWIVIILAGMIVLGISLFYTWFALKNPHITFYDRVTNATGKLIGSCINIYIIVYQLGIVSFEARVLSEITHFYLLQRTPLFVITSIFLIAVFYQIFGDIFSIARFVTVIFPLTMLIFIFLLFMCLKIFHIHNLQPVFSGHALDYLKNLPKSILYFSGVQSILFIIPFMKNAKKLKKAAITSVSSATAIYALTIIIVFGCLSFAGVSTLVWPTISLIQGLEINGLFIERFDIFLITAWTCQLFMCTVTILYITYMGVERLFPRAKKRSILFTLFLLSLATAMIPNDMYEFNIFSSVMGYTFIPVACFPFIIFIVEKYKQWKGKKLC